MPVSISPLSQVHPSARIGQDVEIGPFCLIGPQVTIGDGCRLDSHVSVIGRVEIGRNNRFHAHCVIGGEPQDHVFREDAPVGVQIGDSNIFREGVTVHRGAEKEDGWTRIGDGNMLMANAHVAHNCRLYNHTYLVNGVLLGGHVHVHDRAIISGNTAIHHFASVGTLAFVSGCSKVVVDVPPYMLVAGNDDFRVITINLVGMQRAGLSSDTIRIIKRAHRLLFREHRKLDDARNLLHEELGGIIPIELQTLFTAIENQQKGRQGRAREVFRNVKPSDGDKSAEAA